MNSHTHLFSPMYPNFAALGGVTEELNGTSNVRRHKSKTSPPWVCAKCAKKHPSEMGCGETSYEDDGAVVPDYETLKMYYARTTDDVGAVLGDCGAVHRTIHEQLGCNKCKEGQRKKRKAAAAAAAQVGGGAAYYTPYNMHGAYPVQNSRIGQQFTPLVPPTPPPPRPSTAAVVATVGIGLAFAGTLAYGIFAKRRRR